MAVILSQLLSAADLATLQADLAAANWQDGSATAGPQARSVKANQQLGTSKTPCPSGADLIHCS
jgi:PKHD-type hydroxylase